MRGFPNLRMFQSILMLCNFFLVGGSTIFTKIDEMGDRMEPCLNKDEDSGELVEVDVVVEWQLGRQPHFPHQGDGVTENKDENHH